MLNKPKFTVPKLLHAHASQMRALPTASEARLWNALKGRQLGIGFRRQMPVGPFIADFCGPAKKLVVELDGGYHAARARADARRDRALGRLGFRVLRIQATRVMADFPASSPRFGRRFRPARRLWSVEYPPRQCPQDLGRQSANPHITETAIPSPPLEERHIRSSSQFTLFTLSGSSPR